jgi:hypothetical protein
MGLRWDTRMKLDAPIAFLALFARPRHGADLKRRGVHLVHRAIPFDPARRGSGHGAELFVFESDEGVEHAGVDGAVFTECAPDPHPRERSSESL